MTNTETTAPALAKVGTDTNTLVSNILATFLKATDSEFSEGMVWYLEANSFACELAIRFNVSVEMAATVIAHLSPQMMWDSTKEGDLRMNNKRAAIAVFGNSDTKGIMSASLKNAQRAIDSDSPLDTLNGLKVRSFAANILGNFDAVTVDVWAMRVAFDGMEISDNWLDRKGFYSEVAEAYRIAAATVGISPAVMQAVTWTNKRNNWIVKRNRKVSK